jgi:hypothetical protein
MQVALVSSVVPSEFLELKGTSVPETLHEFFTHRVACDLPGHRQPGRLLHASRAHRKRQHRHNRCRGRAMFVVSAAYSSACVSTATAIFTSDVSDFSGLSKTPS